MKFNGYHHIGLLVTDMDKSLKFYTEGLGGEATFSFPIGGDKVIYLVDLGGNAVVELIPTGTSEPEANARFAHIAVNTCDVPGAYAMALAAGATCKSEPKDVMLGTMACANAFVLGPDGESIEFFQVK